MKNKKKKLFVNTIMLYALTFSTYFFSFITVPYQTRVLGPEFYGKLGFALAFSTYFQLLFDYGFILSGTEDVARNRNNKKELSKILTSINIIKLVLVIISTIFLVILCLTVSKFKEDPLLYILYFIYVAINSFLPDFIYRGIEEMKIITYRTVSIRLLFTVLIFIFLKDKSQYYIVPILNIVGAIISIIIIYYHIYKKLNIKFCKIKLSYLISNFKTSTSFFFSRIASTIYGATNTFILGFIYPTGNILGFYSAADKLISTGKSMLTPISDSIYPYMVKNKDFKLIKKILIILLPIIILGCLVIGFFAEEMCGILLGKEFIGAGKILRLLLPVLVILLPSYLLGFPTMAPLKMSKYSNISVIIGSVIHVVNIILLYITNNLNVYNLCILTVITEFIILLLRIYFIKRKNKYSK